MRGILPVSERLTAAEEASAAARAVGDRFHESSVEYLLANALLNQGDVDAAESVFSHMSFRGALEDWSIADFCAARAIAEGRMAEAAALSDVAHERGAALGETNDGIRALQHWTVARLTGDVDAALHWQEECGATAVGLAFPLRALTALWAGDAPKAREELAAWSREIEPLVPKLMYYSAIHYLSQLAFELDVTDALDAWSEYAERFPGELIGADAGFLGAADAARGRFAALHGDLDRAVGLIEAGHALHERLALPQLIVDTGLDLGTVLLRRGKAGDAERANELLRTTAELASRIGMAPAEQRVRALIA